MDRAAVELKVRELIAEVLNVDIAKVGPEANFVFDLGADSQQSVQLVAAFEKAFDIEVDEDEALEVQDVASAVEFIQSML